MQTGLFHNRSCLMIVLFLIGVLILRFYSYQDNHGQLILSEIMFENYRVTPCVYQLDEYQIGHLTVTGFLCNLGIINFIILHILKCTFLEFN